MTYVMLMENFFVKFMMMYFYIIELVEIGEKKV